MAAQAKTGRAALLRRYFSGSKVSSSAGLLLFVLSGVLSAADSAPGVKVPEGFEVVQYAGDDLAHDIYSMTIDSLGRVVVSGAGYVKILIDADKDGIAESVKTYTDNLPTGAQGMYFLGRDLICAGGDGLIRYRDRDGDDRADGPPDVFLRIKAGNEHDLHAIRKGADGWWYLIAGNAAGINEHYAALPTSPVQKPHAGAILRLKPDLSQGEVFAHGLRNAYDFDFNLAGDLFTFDSDGEKVISLPWYRPTRFLHVLPGAHEGWVTNDWIRPDHFFDMPPVTASLGRGSPTGILTYRHNAFPSAYHGAMFALDWTYGRVYVLPLEKDGSTWKTQPLQFMSAVGQHGFAPTDIEVGPNGELYICVGGRGTQGGVYCVRPTEKNAAAQPWPGGSGSPRTVAERLEVCLQAPQPLSSWSRRVWEPIAEGLTSEPFIKAAVNRDRPTRERIRAIEILTEKFHGIDRDLASRLSSDAEPLVRARAVWSLGRTQPRTPNASALSPFLKDRDPYVVRVAMETLMGVDDATIHDLVEPIGGQLVNQDRFVRQTAFRVLARTSGTNTHKIAQIGFPLGWSASIPVAAAFALSSEGFADYTIDISLKILSGTYEKALKLEAVRVLQIGLGDLTPPAGRVAPVYDGYACRLDLAGFPVEVEKVRRALPTLYPTGLPEVDWELERVMAMVQPADTSLLEKVLAKITPETSPVADIHRLIVASRIPGQRTAPQRAKIADTLVHLESKITAQNLKQDSSWDDRVLEMYKGLLEHDPQLSIAILENPDFGMPGHVQFVADVPQARFQDAVNAFLKQIRSRPDYAWNADLVFFLGASSGAEEMRLIRSKADDFALRGAVITALAVEPQEEDRPIFLKGLETTPVDVMLLCIQSLQLLESSQNAEENVALACALRRLGDRKEERQARDQLVELLRRNLQRQDHYVLGREGDPQREAITDWLDAVRGRFPAEYARASGENGETLTQLKQRLTGISWTRGDSERGQQIFNARGCIQCHGKRRAIGPALDGVAGRFSRDDLFTAIVFPNRDVSPRYQTLQVATVDGQIRVGMLVYEEIDSLVLRDANNQTYRIETKDIEQRRPIAQSLMPGGLLKGLSDEQFADLYAYLQTFGLTSTAAADEPQHVD